jgi:hypothetical protein
MINLQDGSIEFDSPEIRFAGGLTLQQFRASQAFSSFKLLRDLDPAITYRCESVQADGKTFDISVKFYSGVMVQIWMTITEPRRPDGDEHYHRNYVRQICGYQPEGKYGTIEYSYRWGGICVGEPKGCESEIYVNFAAEQTRWSEPGDDALVENQGSVPPDR